MRNNIEVTDSATVFAGPEAVDVFKHTVMARGLKIYAKTGMKPNRMWKQSAMLKLAGEILGRKFKRGEGELAGELLLEHAKNSAVAINKVNEVLTQGDAG